MRRMEKIPLRVSVVIPTYNRAGYLSAAIDSALSQSVPPHEIIVVDDGSEDDTPQVCARYGDLVTYIHQENAGPSSARNNGIEQATGELVAFLDSDDLWLPGKLERQVPLFEADESLGLCATAHYRCDESGKVVGLHSICPTKPAGILREIIARNLFCTPSVMVRRECFRHAGMFDVGLKFGEDWDMWLRVLSLYPGAFIPEPFCNCLCLGAGLTGSLNYRNFIDWKGIIGRNRTRAPTLYGRLIGCNRAMSWYYTNLAYYYRCKGTRRQGIASLAFSLLYWPLFHWKRYYWLISSVPAPPWNTLFKKVAGKRR